MSAANWPDRFVYVCGAGNAATVNVSPLLHSGKRGAVGVVIMSAVSNEKHPTPSDFREAIQPTRRLASFCENVLRLDPATRINVVRGNPDSFRDWKNVLNGASDLARSLDAEIVFNVTGGRKPATMGALLGYRPTDPDAPKLTLVSIGLSPFQARIIEVGRGGDIEETFLPVVDRLSIGSYLRQYDVVETAPEKRLIFEDFLYDASATAKAFGALAAPGEAAALFAELHGRFARKSNRARVDREFRSYTSSPPAQLLHAIAKLPGVSVHPDHSVDVDTELAHDFLTGKWLEGLIFLEARNIFAGRNDVIIAAGLELGVGAPKNRKPAVTEFDLLIRAEDRLDLVEAKAISSETGKAGLHGAIDKLAKYRDRLSGPSGMAWLITPMLDIGELNALDATRHAQNEGVKILHGADAVRQFGRELARSHGIKVKSRS